MYVVNMAKKILQLVLLINKMKVNAKKERKGRGIIKKKSMQM